MRGDVFCDDCRRLTSAACARHSQPVTNLVATTTPQPRADHPAEVPPCPVCGRAVSSDFESAVHECIADHPAEDRLAGIQATHGFSYDTDQNEVCQHDYETPYESCESAFLLSLLTERTADVLAAVSLYEETRTERDAAREDAAGWRAEAERVADAYHAAREDADRLAEALERLTHKEDGTPNTLRDDFSDGGDIVLRWEGNRADWQRALDLVAAHRGSGEAREDG